MTISDIIKAYKADFVRIDSEERYKWIAIGWYKKHWDIDAPDFAGMFQRAYSKHENLLTSQMYYPYRMVTAFAERHPEEVRKLFRMLLDRSIPLGKRYSDFRAGFDDFVKEALANDPGRTKSMSHYQDLHAVSVYLAFEYPQDCTIYKQKIYSGFKDLVGFAEERGSGRYEVWKLENTNRLCNEIMEGINADPDIARMSHERLTEDCYADENNRLLALDIMLYGSKNAEQLEKTSEQHSEKIDDEQTEEIRMTDISKNTILFGPPGTGKTYSTVIYAVAAIEKKAVADVRSEDYDSVLERFNDYKAKGLIVSTTFHQSYGYEEFVEGIKPVMDDDSDVNGDVRYEITAGIFKEFCESASRPVVAGKKGYKLNASPAVWKVSLGGTYDNPTRAECLANGHIRIGWDDYGESVDDTTEYNDGGKNVLRSFLYTMKAGDIVLSCYSNTAIDAIGIVTGDYEWHEEYEQYKRLRKVEWLVKDIREDITAINNNKTMTLATVYRMNIALSDVLAIVEKHQPEVEEDKIEESNYVFIIDEINRGNISKVFGELITLIEPSKRLGQPEGMTVRLPYSRHPFGVPDNVYLIGTMNTADRSISTIDTALRRRFEFVEMQPDAEVLEGISIEDISIMDMLIRMNKRITALYDREHTIGHAYFVPLKRNPTLETLSEIFKHSILPLLQEYFYEDYEKIRLVLGDNRKNDRELQFIVADDEDYSELFGDTDYEFDDNRTYSVNFAAFDNIEAYRSI